MELKFYILCPFWLTLNNLKLASWRSRVVILSSSFLFATKWNLGRTGRKCFSPSAPTHHLPCGCSRRILADKVFVFFLFNVQRATCCCLQWRVAEVEAYFSFWDANFIFVCHFLMKVHIIFRENIVKSNWIEIGHEKAFENNWNVSVDSWMKIRKKIFLWINTTETREVKHFHVKEFSVWTLSNFGFSTHI